MPIRRVAEDVFHIPLTPRDGVNAYLLGDVVVDAGTKVTAKRLIKALHGHAVGAHALTHAHLDHAGGSKRLVEAFDVPVWVGERDRADVESGRPAGARDVGQAGGGAPGPLRAGRASRARCTRATTSATASSCSRRRGTPTGTSPSGARATARWSPATCSSTCTCSRPSPACTSRRGSSRATRGATATAPGAWPPWSPSSRSSATGRRCATPPR